MESPPDKGGWGVSRIGVFKSNQYISALKKHVLQSATAVSVKTELAHKPLSIPSESSGFFPLK